MGGRTLVHGYNRMPFCGSLRSERGTFPTAVTVTTGQLPSWTIPACFSRYTGTETQMFGFMLSAFRFSHNLTFRMTPDALSLSAVSVSRLCIFFFQQFIA